jgi:putative endonuclease
MASRKSGTLYVGVTSDLQKRVYQHREGLVDGFTKKHSLHLLVHFEVLDDITDAIRREKQLKNWTRAWKVQLIEEQNPEWNDLYATLF